MRPLFALTERGFLVRLSAGWLPVSAVGGAPAEMDRWPLDAFGKPTRIVDHGHLASVLGVADDGMVYGFDARVVPQASDGDMARRMGMRQAVESWVAIDDRDALRHHGLFIHVTRAGKIKASKNSDFPNPIHSDGTIGFILDEADEALGVCVARRDEPIFLASSNGYAIVFDLSELRPQGRKATGVRGIGLRDGAHVVGFCRPSEHEQVAMISEQGYAKRVELAEYRPQSRAGLGLQSAKLGSGDSISAVAGCDAMCDLLILTNLGRLLRIPNHLFPLMARPARGDRVLDLAEGEIVTGITSLLPMEF